MKQAPIERESAFLLLVLQSGIGLVTAAGPIVLSLGGSPGNALLALLTILLAMLELVLAVLFLRGSRRAASFAQTLAEMEERDKRDSERDLAPLRRAEDALTIDSSALDADAVARQVVAEIQKRL